MKPTLLISSRRTVLRLGSAAGAALALWPLVGCQGGPRRAEKMIDGMVWQPDNQTLELKGSWDRLGARTLLIQWTAVNDLSFMADGPWPPAPRLPDWQAIARQPWAQDVILGLAGRTDETAARADAAGLIAVSEQMARLPTPLHVVGWYFPVELDSSWQQAMQLGPLLARLPRPLWLSLYDSANVGARTVADWVDGWLPPDIGIFFQDGVGVYARTAAVAREHADVLIGRLGRARVRMIAEAFRPQPGGGFRPATAEELRVQLAAYEGLPVYLFDGPHYVPDAVVNALALNP